VQAVITEFGLTLDEEWSICAETNSINLAEEACKKLAKLGIYPSGRNCCLASYGSIAGSFLERKGSTHSAGDRTRPCNHALVPGDLPASPKGEGMVLWNAERSIDDPNGPLK
jgi:hypothetical protein